MPGDNPPTVPLSLFTHHHLNTRVPVKLDLDNWNYGSWVFFFEQLCSGFEVLKYIHGMPNDTPGSTSTPLTTEEQKVDNIILSWIFTTLSESLQARLVMERPQSAKHAWDLITDLVHDNKRSRAIALKAELRTIKLGDMTHSHTDRPICGDFRSRTVVPDRGTIPIWIAGDRELKPIIVVPNRCSILHRIGNLWG
ncbi:hypothetical protein CTI12_AA405190 [Artemisia annua]|uniref:Retrotransposon Copia-like N-terminal domain-containing protein n=1 Tax=Artemisia annua TaxID=35608 RepID=A0A2U1M984_ARTAN|nr:hypothetical protein CTI12_AA405190 [Artemisia annua]